MDCLFCKIAEGEIPSTKVYEDEYVYAFRDINPQAKIHVVVIPRRHIASCADEIDGTNSDVIAKLFEAIPKIAGAAGMEGGYRIINNCGKNACQSIPHIHFHLLGGEQLSERMG